MCIFCIKSSKTKIFYFFELIESAGWGGIGMSKHENIEIGVKDENMTGNKFGNST